MARGRWLGILTATGAAFAVAPGGARADEPVVNLQLEAGSELDTNPTRATAEVNTPYAPLPAAVGRGGVRFALGWRPAPRRALRVSAIAAAKKFVGADGVADEDVAVLAGDLRYDARLGDAPVAWGARVSYYDALERDGDTTGTPDHDFRTGDGALSLTLLGEHDHRATIAAGYRLFEYKPDSRYDFAGEHVRLDWKKTFEPEPEPDADLDAAQDNGDGSGVPAPAPALAEDGPTWDVAASYSFARRAYADRARVNTCAPAAELATGCLVSVADDRVDISHAAGAEVTFTGERIYAARYELQLTLSNSFGQSLLRHRVELSATSETFWSVFVTARLVVQVSQFLDPLLLSRDIGVLTIEDENRNALTLHATRDLTPHWAIEARYSFYSNEFATQELRFRRQTAYLGLVWRL